MRIALVQMSMCEDITENLDKSLKNMEKAAENGADMVVFPEIQLSPFFPQYKARDVSNYIMTLESKPVLAIEKKSKELGLVTIPNFYLRENDKLYDACPVFEKTGEILGVSKMVHIVQIKQFYEQDYYTPSDTGFKVYDTSVGRAGVVICFDRHYPESIRSCVLQGAQIIIIPTAIIKNEPLEKFEWEVKMAAWQNNVFLAICNRVGIEGDMDFAGNSLILDPEGDVLAQGSDKEEILYADIDYQKIITSRKERPLLALRRPESYHNSV